MQPVTIVEHPESAADAPPRGASRGEALRTSTDHFNRSVVENALTRVVLGLRLPNRLGVDVGVEAQGGMM